MSKLPERLTVTSHYIMTSYNKRRLCAQHHLLPDPPRVDRMDSSVRDDTRLTVKSVLCPAAMMFVNCLRITFIMVDNN